MSDITRLFDEIAREYEGPAMYAEPSFKYLNRSARPAVETIRQTLQSWFLRYPGSEQADLRGRFRSSDDRQHHSAFFELLLHELLLQMGCRVEIHPEAPDSSTTAHPDFLVESPQGLNFFAEAVVATALSEEESAARARMNDVYDALNRLDSPNFFLGLDIIGAPATPPSARQMRAFLKTRLDKLDPDEVAKLWQSGGIRAVPHWRYEHEGWIIDFHPIQVPETKGPEQRASDRDAVF